MVHTCKAQAGPGGCRTAAEAGPERGHVRAREPAAIGGMVSANGGRDLTLVESGVRRSQACRTALRGRRLLQIDHVLQRAGQIGLAKDLAGTRRTAARKKHLRIAGKAPVLGFVDNKGVAKTRIGGKAITGQSDSRLRHISKTHCAVTLKCRDPARWRARNHRPQEPFRDAPAVMFAKPCGGRLGRPNAETIDGDDLARSRKTDHDRRNARHVDEIGAGDAEGETGCHAGVDRISAASKIKKPACAAA